MPSLKYANVSWYNLEKKSFYELRIVMRSGQVKLMRVRPKREDERDMWRDSSEDKRHQIPVKKYHSDTQTSVLPQIGDNLKINRPRFQPSQHNGKSATE